MVSKISSKEKRGAIISLYNDGKKPLFILNTLNIPRNTVYGAIKHHKELGSLEDRPRSGRPVAVATIANKEKIRKKISRNPQRSMRTMTKTMKISKDSVRKIVTTMLGHRYYKISKCHFLNDNMKLNRFKKACRMLRLIAAGRYHSILFTDEKICTIENYHNHQNDR